MFRGRGSFWRFRRSCRWATPWRSSFFLGDDPDPVSASAVVKRAVFDPERLRRSYGVAFTRIEPGNAQRIAQYCEE